MKKLIMVVLFLFGFVLNAFAGNPFNYPLFQGIDSDGNPISGGLVYTYEPGTTTPKVAYTDQLLTVSASNPIVLDSNGQYEFYLKGVYKIDVKTSTGSQVPGFPLDNVSGPSASSGESVFVYDYGCDLSAAVTAIGAVTETTLDNSGCDCIIPDGTSVQITDNISFLTPNGSSIDGVAGGGTEALNLLGPLSAGGYQIFGENLTATVVNSPVVYSEWWPSFANFASDMVSTVCSVILHQETELDADVTSSTFIEIIRRRGGRFITDGTPRTITIEGMLTSGVSPSTIFRDGVTVDGDMDVDHVYPDWWETGPLNSAIVYANQRTSGTPIKILNNVYELASNAVLDSNVTIVRDGTGTIDGSGLYSITIPVTPITNENKLFEPDTTVVMTGQSVNAGWFGGGNIGERINNAMVAINDTSERNEGTVIIPAGFSGKEFETQIKINSDKTIVFGKIPIIYTGTSNAIRTWSEDLLTANAQTVGTACLRAKLTDMNIDATAGSSDIVLMYGARNTVIDNPVINKSSGATTLLTAAIAFVSGDASGAGGPGGCHYNIVNNLVHEGGASLFLGTGIRLEQEGTQNCNANRIVNPKIAFTKTYGINLINGIGNVIEFPTIESVGGGDQTAGTGIKIAGFDNTISNLYFENLLYGVDMDGATTLSIHGGLPNTTDTAVRNRADDELFSLVWGNRSDWYTVFPNFVSAPIWVKNELSAGTLTDRP